jgi:hypothetical protein
MSRKTDRDPAAELSRMPISQRYLRFVERPLPERERKKLGLWKGATWGDALVFQQYNSALQGRSEAAREIREAIEGKSDEGIFSSADRQVEIRVVWDDEKQGQEENNINNSISK